MQNPIPLEKGVISFTKFCMRSQANFEKLYGAQTQSSQKELVLSGPGSKNVSTVVCLCGTSTHFKHSHTQIT